MLKDIARSYTTLSRDQNTNTDNGQTKPITKKKSSQNSTIVPENLCDVLPIWDSDLTKDKCKPYIVITYLPDGTQHRIKRACDKAGIRLFSKPGIKLKDMLCGRNKIHHYPSKKSGLNQIICLCSP